MKKKQFTCNILCAMALLGATTTVYADDVTTQEATPVIIPKAQLAPITITGTRYIESDTFAGGYLEKKANFGVLGERSIMETPFNMTAMTAKAMDDIQANNIIDVAAMDASVNNQTLGGASQAWAIRGFRSQQQDVALNGLYGIAPRFYTGTEALESVEILKGASALLYGMAPNGSVGGTINYVPKRASSEPNSNSFKVTYGDGKQFGKQLDYGVRTNDDKWGFHTTLYQTNGSTSYTNEQIKTQSAAVNVDRKGSHSKFSLDLGYAYNDVENPQYRVSFDDAYLENIQKLGLPTADHNKTYGAPGTFRHVTEKYGMARYDYDFNKSLSAYAAVGLRATKTQDITNQFQLTAPNATYPFTTVSSSYRQANQLNKANSAEVGIKKKFKTGSVKHEMSLAASRLSWNVYNGNISNIIKDKKYTSGLSYDDPVWPTFPGATWKQPLSAKNTLAGVSLADVITTPNDAWTFVIGGRYQHVKETGYNVNTGLSKGTVNEHAWSPAFAVIRKFNDKVSVYANYMQGLSAGEVVAGSAANGVAYGNRGDILPTAKTQQVEVGAKFNTGKMLTTVSLFQMREPTEAEVLTGKYNKDGKGVYDYLRTGETRNRGIEVSVSGEPKEGTRLMGGLMYLDSKLTSGETNVGKTHWGVPHWQAVARIDQDIKSVKGLSLSARANYVGSSYVDPANQAKVGGRVTWDLGAKYQFKGIGGHPMILRTDVYNVFNKDYWSTISNATPALYIGKGRTAVVSLETKF